MRFGLFGGEAGSINELEFEFPGGRRFRPRSKELIPEIPRGSVMRQIAGGGGGYGDPKRRPLSRVIEDVKNGVLSVQKAREEYGVALDPETLEVDGIQTERLRRLSGNR